MFTLISSAINNTMEVLAPTIAAEDQFVWHWKQVMNFYETSDKTSRDVPIEATNISLHLQKMCHILCDEQSPDLSDNNTTDVLLNGSSIGPSMEYLMQNKILDTMSSLAQTDTPLGLTHHILQFFTTLLTHSSHELLPHKCVYSSVQKIIVICGKLIAGPYESSEVKFLTCICDKIHENPQLINCFLSDSFPLITALLALLQSPDQVISTTSGDALLRLLDSVNERAEEIIAFETPFSCKIADQLVSLYQAIPRSLRAEQMESAINCCFKSVDTESATNFESFSPAVRKFLCFLRWFVFIDMIVNHLSTKESILRKTLLDNFKKDFLEACICPDLLGMGYESESDAADHIFLTTVLVSNCLRNTVSEYLSTTIGEFLIVDTKTDQLINNPKYNEKTNKLKNILLDRCRLIETNLANDEQNSSSITIDCKRIQLCMSSMQLFEDILVKPSVSILNELVVQYLSDRSFLDEYILTNDTNSDFSEFSNLMSSYSNSGSEEGSAVNFNYVSTSHVQRMLQYFTSLVPDELKSCVSDDDLGYENYVREAQKHFKEVGHICNKWKNWSTESIILDDSQSTADEKTNNIVINGKSEHKLNSKSENQFFEGPFMAMIFDNLEHMVQLPYEVNLQVTSLISRLALFPHQYLNEYLLDPTIPLVCNTRSLFSILHKLVDELQILVQGMNGLKDKLQITRKSLLGESDKCEAESNDTTDGKTLRIMEALIVIEEFCKELAAVAFVKYHNTF
ncbi:FHF complex subunit HOOK interacting protein 2A-like [Oppia nitens]|uniref:FHF complex subunit HOOK interacting protein 2A-like n=1 Tax=Oppia nitens TaxID=1686743 RepID=UPI0023DACF15|nr:FHF complex subunit HOOK interacting protein 2A-like [Oppia nitens]